MYIFFNYLTINRDECIKQLHYGIYSLRGECMEIRKKFLNI